MCLYLLHVSSSRSYTLMQCVCLTTSAPHVNNSSFLFVFYNLDYPINGPLDYSI